MCSLATLKNSLLGEFPGGSGRHTCFQPDGQLGEDGMCIDVIPGRGSKVPHAVAVWPNKKPLNSQCSDFSVLTHYLSLYLIRMVKQKYMA